MSDAVASLHAAAEVLRAAGLLVEVRAPGDVAVRGVTQDSRATAAGDLFLAWKGVDADAHDFVEEAARRGAAAAVVERALDLPLPQIVTSDGRRAAALLAEAVLGRPSRRLFCVGVTGTNGKTTTAVLVRHLLGADLPAGVVGTLGLMEEGGVRPGTEGLTTPGPVQLARWLRELDEAGYRAVAMEASSHALEQHRLDGIAFDVGVFTNLTQDHLDYHGDLDAYRRAKSRLAELVVPDGTLVVNASDPAWVGVPAEGRRVLTFGIGVDADVRADDVALAAHGTAFSLTVDGVAYTVRTPLLARYNVENALAATAAALAAGVDVERVVERLTDAPHVKGRLEAVRTEPFTVLIDFAHSPAALESALAAIKPLTPGRLITVFGAGGDRDRTKRAPMGRAVRALSDVIVLTNDNPRTEDPEQILDDVAEGLAGVPYERFVDRRDAIRRALAIARPGDTVVLTGKGHETYQTVGTEKLPFDERQIVEECLADLGVAR